MTPKFLQINADHIINLSRVAMVRRKAGSTTLYFNTDNWSYNVTDDDGGERIWNYLTSIAQQLPDGSDTDTDASDPDGEMVALMPLHFPTAPLAHQAQRDFERRNPDGQSLVWHRVSSTDQASEWVLYRNVPQNQFEEDSNEPTNDAPLPNWTDLPPITYPTENIAYEAARAWERAHPEGVANVQHRTALQARMSGWVVFRRLPRRLGTAWPVNSAPERHRGTPEEIAAAEKQIRDAMRAMP